ncbi:Metallophosphoesterase domain-containing protein 1 [Gracilariopsis chorda]|uniref:Metallophosphoesterase domain-containing protein 1 n=1 Tax=Gracilariopsis chorda TaxID=448386 RepID=A0A2V3IQG4_9FLOR|nr:Metallophosphoesterase domain-containing protein 1 [Gracilariopsis chorda]|eukprot:PXF44336.1 Metallophosphoesterase domain-containing protein 1 [Gracilariopsis chorda]
MAASNQYVGLVIVSDTHRWFCRSLPFGDIVIHCGDSEWGVSGLEAWASNLPHQRKFVIPQNMDCRLKEQTKGYTNVTYLQDKEIEVSWLKIYGSPWTPKFVGEFQVEDEKRAHAVWNRMPTDVDVLITHEPTKGILDVTSRGMSIGDSALLEKACTVRSRVHCLGHVHKSYRTLNEEHTLFCNAAVFNHYPPIVVDVPMNKTQPPRIAS